MSRHLQLVRGLKQPDVDLREEWGINTSDDAIAAWHLVTEAMESAVLGHRTAIRILAVIGIRHLLGVRGQRLLVIGPHGVGKTTLLRSLADALGVPFAILDVTTMSETGFQGYDLADFLNDFSSAHGHRAARGLILLDEVDKIATRDMSGSDRDWRIGKQQSLAPLLGIGSPIPMSGGGQFDSERTLIVMAGMVDLAKRYTPGALHAIGIMPEIVERFGCVVQLTPLGVSELAEMLRRHITPMQETFETFGYSLQVPAETLRFAAHCVRVSSWGPRSSVALLTLEAERALVELLGKGAPPGTVVSLTPDDVASAGGRSTPPDDEGHDPIWTGAGAG